MLMIMQSIVYILRILLNDDGGDDDVKDNKNQPFYNVASWKHFSKHFQHEHIMFYKLPEIGRTSFTKVVVMYQHTRMFSDTEG